MDIYEAMGLLGAILSSLTFLPQVIRTWKIKSAEDLSMGMLVIVFCSTIVWLVYGFALWLIPVIIANTAIFTLSLTLIYFKITFKRNKTKMGS
ncbi:SemiSWEET family transporter [uncultured Roseivirga sp.]|uniref:SemiSWEET family sugar transporter n=1 Tax=uncultured Roseivirga sp. TaxID=543088 RepID=UPI0030D8003D|tara:strand:- start:1743 stop:2021 length:279 start_codon:yes stop_codon:yes gene_type:complete